jgi:hypothetical protein
LQEDLEKQRKREKKVLKRIQNSGDRRQNNIKNQKREIGSQKSGVGINFA